MKTLIIGLACTALAFGQGKGKGSCTDPRLKWEVLGSYADGAANFTSAITSDGGIYEDGVSNVSAKIDQCGGTYDAKLFVDPALRNIFVNFSKPLYTTSLTPTQAANGETVGCLKICWLFMIRNLTFVPEGENRERPYFFTTHLTGGGPLNSHLWMMNPAATAVRPVNDTSINAPYTNALLRVYHCPANFTGTSDYCVPGKNEQWIVWPDSTVFGNSTQTGLPASQTATLKRDAIRPNPAGNGGEFSVPFRFVITALQ